MLTPLSQRSIGAQVVGTDASSELLEAAQKRGIKTILMDAHDLQPNAPQIGQFDAVLSNAALHWMVDLQQVLAGVYAVLVPGGRLVAEMGGQGNVTSIFTPLRQALAPRGLDADALSPWVFPSAEEVSKFCIVTCASSCWPSALPHAAAAETICRIAAPRQHCGCVIKLHKHRGGISARARWPDAALPSCLLH